MKVSAVEAFAVRIDHHYKVAGRDHQPHQLGTTSYYLEPAWRQVYSTDLRSCLIKVTADDGTVGWGEAQAPIAPEVVVSAIDNLIGPALLGQPVMAHRAINERLTHMMDVRGHREGFLNDAIAGVDIALWDLKGKRCGQPVASLLGADVARPLPLYVSGVRKPTLGEQAAAAAEYMGQGYAGVKLFIGAKPHEAARQVARVREAIGPDRSLMVDLLWGYTLDEARELAPHLEKCGVAFVEAPMALDDLAAHASLAAATWLPIAVGEHVRDARALLPWARDAHARLLQPDVARTGITEGLRILALAQTEPVELTWHVGTCTPVAMAATWHIAAATAANRPLEHQAELWSAVAPLISEPMTIRNGVGELPQAPGLGVTVNEAAVRAVTTAACEVHV